LDRAVQLLRGVVHGPELALGDIAAEDRSEPRLAVAAPCLALTD
jgi:hypothetical protein